MPCIIMHAINNTHWSHTTWSLDHVHMQLCHQPLPHTRQTPTHYKHNKGKEKPMIHIRKNRTKTAAQHNQHNHLRKTSTNHHRKTSTKTCTQPNMHTTHSQNLFRKTHTLCHHPRKWYTTANHPKTTCFQWPDPKTTGFRSLGSPQDPFRTKKK